MSTCMSSVGAERTGLAIVVFVGHAVSPAGSSLTPRATILSAPSGSGRCSFSASSGDAIIQISTSSAVVRITGIAFGWTAPTSALGSVVRNAYSFHSSHSNDATARRLRDGWGYLRIRAV
jgi:hypothetical protein